MKIDFRLRIEASAFEKFKGLVDLCPQVEMVCEGCNADLRTAADKCMACAKVVTPQAGASARVVPEALRTPEASALLNKAVAAGWLDDRWQPMVSSTKAALLAMRLAEILKIENQWQVFGELWKRNSGTLRSKYNTGMEQNQTRAILGQMNKVLKR